MIDFKPDYKTLNSSKLYIQIREMQVLKRNFLPDDLLKNLHKSFMIMDTVPDFDHDKAMEELAQKPRQTEWEMLVSKYQQTEEGTGSSADKWQRMERIYKLP